MGVLGRLIGLVSLGSCNKCGLARLDGVGCSTTGKELDPSTSPSREQTQHDQGFLDCHDVIMSREETMKFDTPRGPRTYYPTPSESSLDSAAPDHRPAGAIVATP